jgi:ribosome-binding protein aMBF1 (putative translation factor)
VNSRGLPLLGLCRELKNFHRANVAIRYALDLQSPQRRNAVAKPQSYGLLTGTEVRSDRRLGGKVTRDQLVGRVHNLDNAPSKTYPSSFSVSRGTGGASKICLMIWDEIADRLSQAFEATMADKDWPWPRLAKEIGTKKTTLKNWTSGRHFPSKRNWEQIQRVTEISVDEFILGEGRAAKVVQLRDSVCENQAEVELLRAYRNCNPTGRDHIKAQATFALQQFPQDAHIVRFQQHNNAKK